MASFTQPAVRSPDVVDARGPRRARFLHQVLVRWSRSITGRKRPRPRRRHAWLADPPVTLTIWTLHDEDLRSCLEADWR